MKIGVVTHNYPPHLGGLETIARELVKRFARSHEVAVVSTAWEGRQGTSIEDGATIHRLPAIHRTESWGVPYAMPTGPGLRAAIAALSRCDVVHAHGSLYATTLLGLLSKGPGAPLFVTEHVGFVQYPSQMLNHVQRLAWATIGDAAVRHSAGVIAYNSRVLQWLGNRFLHVPTFFIPNGVDSEEFRLRGAGERSATRARLALPESERIGLFVGRAAQKKNFESVLRFSRASYRLAVCGAPGLSVPSDVIDLGALPHSAMPDVFAAVDFLVHAATGEGFPVAVQEAMASGLPVALLWDEGYAGVVRPESVVRADSLQALDDSCLRLSTDESLRASIGQAAREFAVTNWDWAITSARYLDLFSRHRGRV